MQILIWVIIVLLLAGIADYFIRTAPIIAGEYKAGARWVLLLLVVVFILLKVWPSVSHLTR